MKNGEMKLKKMINLIGGIRNGFEATEKMMMKNEVTFSRKLKSKTVATN